MNALTIPYCLPLRLSRTSEVLDTVSRLGASYPYFEIWLDYLEDFSFDFIEQIEAQKASNFIFILRRLPGETCRNKLNQRIEIIRKLSGSKNYLDLDLNLQRDELEYIKATRWSGNLITSFHNYDATPTDDELRVVYKRMLAFPTKVLKFSTFCKSESDTVRLLQLQQFIKNEKHEHIVLGMGPHGQATRIFGTLWGNKVVFAPEKTELSSAPGQLTRTQLESIYTLLT